MQYGKAGCYFVFRESDANIQGLFRNH
jgi:hypothetical protein